VESRNLQKNGYSGVQTNSKTSRQKQGLHESESHFLGLRV